MTGFCRNRIWRQRGRSARAEQFKFFRGLFRVPTQEVSMTYDIPALQDYSGDTAPEHKSGMAARGDYDDFRITFEEFKAANDERLARLEKKRGDVLLEEKVDRINAALDAQARRMDDLALKHARPVLEGRGRIVSDTTSREHKSAFEAYVRGGEAGALRTLETKALAAGSDADGGYLVPDELEHTIGERLAAISPI